MGKYTFKNMKTGDWETRNSYESLWVRDVTGPYTMRRSGSDWIVEETGDADWVDDPITVSCEFGAKLIVSKLNEHHAWETGSFDGQMMETPKSDDREYMSGYHSGYSDAMQNRVEYAQELMKKYPGADPSGEAWENVWSEYGYHDEENAVQYALPILWEYMAQNGYTMDWLPMGAAVQNVSTETMNAVFASDGSDTFIAYGEQTA